VEIGDRGESGRGEEMGDNAASQSEHGRAAAAAASATPVRYRPWWGCEFRQWKPVELAGPTLCAWYNGLLSYCAVSISLSLALHTPLDQSQILSFDHENKIKHQRILYDSIFYSGCDNLYFSTKVIKLHFFKFDRTLYTELYGTKDVEGSDWILSLS
jgi:hypothetical protein